MTETKFTPGPWANDKTIKVRGLNFLSHCHYETSEGSANAHLIAAAPELYEALELAVDELKAWVKYAEERSLVVTSTNPAIEHCEAALAKARGEV